HKAGKESAHGAPLGKDEVAATREALGWPYPSFEIPQEIRDGWRAGNAGTVREHQWNELFDAYKARHPDIAEELVPRSRGELPEGFVAEADAFIAKLQVDGRTIASPKAPEVADGAVAALPAG